MFYHGSDVGVLEELRPSNSNQGNWVYLSDLKDRICPYLINPLQVFVDKKYGKGTIKVTPHRIARFRDKNGITELFEPFPNYFHDYYKGQTAYIYSFEKVDGVEFLGKPHVFGVRNPIKVQKVEVIPDAYDYLMQLEKEGDIILTRFEDMSKEEIEHMNKQQLEFYKYTSYPFAKQFWYDNIPYIREHANDENF